MRLYGLFGHGLDDLVADRLWEVHRRLGELLVEVVDHHQLPWRP